MTQEPEVVADWDAAARLPRPPLVVLAPLRRLLDEHGVGDGPLDVHRLSGGHSNATFEVTRGDRRLVLRRPPRPPLPPGAHDVVREARILTALGDTAVRAPAVRVVCEDPGVIGAPFYVMDHVAGVALTDAVPEPLCDPAIARAWSDDLVDALAEIHAVDWRAAGLGGIGRPSGYLERQVRRFLQLWEHNRTRDLPEVDRVGAWLGRTAPDSPETTLVHGDYRLGNLMLAGPPEPRVAAVFDWELATLGDPLADLGYLTATWVQADDDPPIAMFAQTNAMRAPGFASREQLVARYAERTGRRTDTIAWYRALALWKTVVFMEGNHKRALEVGTDDPFTATLGDRVAELARRVAAEIDDR